MAFSYRGLTAASTLFNGKPKATASDGKPKATASDGKPKATASDGKPHFTRNATQSPSACR
jgi:hypothetical protein